MTTHHAHRPLLAWVVPVVLVVRVPLVQVPRRALSVVRGAGAWACSARGREGRTADGAVDTDDTGTGDSRDALPQAQVLAPRVVVEEADVRSRERRTGAEPSAVPRDACQVVDHGPACGDDVAAAAVAVVASRLRWDRGEEPLPVESCVAVLHGGQRAGPVLPPPRQGQWPVVAYCWWWWWEEQTRWAQEPQEQRWPMAMMTVVVADETR